MKTFIPHKDTLFFLAAIQKKIIADSGKSVSIYPLYPLFSFYENDFPTAMKSCTINEPKAKNEHAVFPLAIECENEILNLEIKFARTADNSKMPELNLPPEIKNAFPRKERSFRLADMNFENNGWQVINEKWHKIKN